MAKEPWQGVSHDLFIKSYRKDFPWLIYCLRSIAKFSSGFRDIIIVVPEEDRKEIDTWGLTMEKVFSEVEYGRGYLLQQVRKLTADKYTDADVIVFIDSDCLLSKPFSPPDLYSNGKITMLMTPYTEMPPDFPWQKPTEKALGFPCPYETMRRHPFVYPSRIIKACRDHIENLHQTDIEDYIMSQEAFSEFNAVGSFCWEKHRESFDWIDTTKANELPPLMLKQYWSHDPNFETLKKEMEAILA